MVAYRFYKNDGFQKRSLLFSKSSKRVGRFQKRFEKRSKNDSKK